VTTLNPGVYYFNIVHVETGGTVTISGGITQVYQPAQGVTIFAQTFNVDAGATITGTGQGNPSYNVAGNLNADYGNDGGGVPWSPSSGGGHGGAGGNDYDYYCYIIAGGIANDNPIHPSAPGYGGGGNLCSGYGPNYGSGGGLLWVIVYNPSADTVTGPATVNGMIDMSGGNGSYSNFCSDENAGGGSGGAIFMEAESIAGNGVLQANGGNGAGDGGGGGGGGIISLVENLTSYPGSLLVNGGAGNTSRATNGCAPPNTNGFAGSVTFTAPPASGY
jgi:hypothetical protein